MYFSPFYHQALNLTEEILQHKTVSREVCSPPSKGSWQDNYDQICLFHCTYHFHIKKSILIHPLQVYLFLGVKRQYGIEIIEKLIS